MDFCFVPRGRFWMGSDLHEGQSECMHEPQHRLNLGSYWISRHKVSAKELAEFESARRVEAPEEESDAEELRAGEGDGLATWFEARDFTRWLTGVMREDWGLSDKWECRLPSEAEWEKAARGGMRIPTTPIVTARPGANPTPRVKKRWNWQPWRSRPEGDKKSAAKSDPSPYGCERMCDGREWTRSLYGEVGTGRLFYYPYRAGDGREDLEAHRDFLRVRRGGATCYRRHPERPGLVSGRFRVVLGRVP